MRQHHDSIAIRPRRAGLHEVTAELAAIVRGSGMADGLATLLVLHTSASLTVQENADPAARRDLEAFLDRLVPEGDALFEHVAEGADDMPAHVRSALTLTSLSVPFRGGALRLGTWQGVWLWEHRRGGRPRTIAVHLLGE